MTATPYNPKVLLTKTVFMQRCADHIRAGYYLQTTGVVPLARATALVRKFRDLYLVHLGKDARYRRKRAGLGNAHLLLWKHAEEMPELTFALLVTPVDHPAHQLEKLADSREPAGRLELTGYELIRQTRPGSTAPAWTWRMTDDTYQRWRERVLGVIRTRDDVGLRQAWYSLHLAPGFAPIRRQVRQVEKLGRAEYPRVRGRPFIYAPRRPPYVARLPDNALPLSIVIQKFRERGTQSDLDKRCLAIREGNHCASNG